MTLLKLEDVPFICFAAWMLQEAVIALREAEAEQLRSALNAERQRADLQAQENAALKKRVDGLERKASKLRKVAGAVGVAAFVAGLVLK